QPGLVFPFDQALQGFGLAPGQCFGERLWGDAAGALLAVQRQVAGDAEEPRAEGRGGFQRGQADPGFHEGVLGQVLGPGGVAGQRVDPATDAVPVQLDERGEGGTVPVPGAADPLSLRRGLHVLSLPWQSPPPEVTTGRRGCWKIFLWPSARRRHNNIAWNT